MRVNNNNNNNNNNDSIYFIQFFSHDLHMSVEGWKENSLVFPVLEITIQLKVKLYPHRASNVASSVRAGISLDPLECIATLQN